MSKGGSGSWAMESGCCRAGQSAPTIRALSSQMPSMELSLISWIQRAIFWMKARVTASWLWLKCHPISRQSIRRDKPDRVRWQDADVIVGLLQFRTG